MFWNYCLSWPFMSLLFYILSQKINRKVQLKSICWLLGKLHVWQHFCREHYICEPYDRIVLIISIFKLNSDFIPLTCTERGWLFIIFTFPRISLTLIILKKKATHFNRHTEEHFCRLRKTRSNKHDALQWYTKVTASKGCCMTNCSITRVQVNLENKVKR